MNTPACSGVFELALHGLSGARNTRVTGAFLFVEQRSVVVCDRVLRPHKRRAVPCPRRLPRSRDLRSLPFRYHVSWPLGAIGDLVAAGSLARQLRVNNSFEPPPALASSGSLCTDWSGARNTVRESLAPSCILKSALWRCVQVASLRVTLCIDLRRFRLRVLATLLRRSDCSPTRASTPEQTRIRQVAAERFPSSTHDSRPLARWSLRVDTERANCFPLMPAVWHAGWQQGDPSGVASVGIVGVASPCLARACRRRASVRVRVTDQNKLCCCACFCDERN